jgi:hypothetical protein
MDKDILEVLEKSISDTKIDKVSPNKELLDIVLSMQGDRIGNLTDSELTNYMFVLAQYQFFLQSQVNYKLIRYLESKREYEFALAKECSKIEAKTIKEKEAKALSSSEYLQTLEKSMRIKNADHIMFDKIPENLSEMANALKKELSLRTPNTSGGGRYGR